MAETIKDPQQWTWDSPLMQSRNHHPDGQMQILQQISMHFHLPAGPAAWKPHTDGQQLKYWRQMLWMTQVNQAVGYKVEVEHDFTNVVPDEETGDPFEPRPHNGRLFSFEMRRGIMVVWAETERHRAGTEASSGRQLALCRA